MNFIKDIDRKVLIDFMLNIHYAGRLAPVSFSYGIEENGEIVGILTIGKPASSTICASVCGKEYAHKVYELNRLCLKKQMPKNILSKLVSFALRDLKSKEIIIISYADSAMSHYGYIYQATNWIYTGATKERTDPYVEKGKHARHEKCKFNGFRKVRTSKHRYVYFTSNKKKMINLLSYKIEKYPKGENKNYVLGFKLEDKIVRVEK